MLHKMTLAVFAALILPASALAQTYQPYGGPISGAGHQSVRSMAPVYDPRDAQPAPFSPDAQLVEQPGPAAAPLTGAPIYDGGTPALTAAPAPVYGVPAPVAAPVLGAPVYNVGGGGAASAPLAQAPVYTAPTLPAPSLRAPSYAATPSSAGGITCDGVWSPHANNDRDGDGAACEQSVRTPSVGSYGGGSTRVGGYYRKDGTYVRSHTRRARRR